MDKIALEIVYHLADLQYEYDCESGQRWPTLLSCQKSHILALRSVCRAFRDASWLAFRNVLAERIFYLNEEDLAVLSEISTHPRLAPLIKTLTFGSQVFTQNGLRILEHGLQEHPAHLELHGGPGAWQRQLAHSRSNLPYDELVQFKELYETGLARQELLWSSGDALAILSDCLYRLSSKGLQSIHICPRPCHVTFELKGKGRLSFSSRNRTQWIPHGAVNHTRCNAWRNIDRTLTALAQLDGSLLQLHDLRTSSLSNIRWPMNSTIFKNTILFRNLRSLQLSIREDILSSDYTYAIPDSEHAARQFVQCLLAAPHLTSLDLEMCSMGEDAFASPAIKLIAEANVPFRLEHLALEYNVQSEEVLTELMRPHAKTLKRVVLMNTWITEGWWGGWLQSTRELGVRLDYLEVWKPTQWGHEVGIEAAEDMFRLRDVSAIAEKGNVVCCLPQEQWNNCYPRFARR